MSKVPVLAAAISASLWSNAAGQTPWIADHHTSPHVGVFLDFEHDPSTSSLQIMERVAGAALAATGAQFSWRRLKKDRQSEMFDELAVLRFRGNCRMEKLAAADVLDPRPVMLGETDLVSGVVSAYSNVECDQIKSCISGLLGASCARDRETAFGRALGRVVAHELYHILARTTEHTRTGLSKGVQTSFDLIRENFQFDKQVLFWLRQRLFSPFNLQRPAAASLLAADH